MDITCSICLDTKFGELITHFNCNHEYHRDCLDDLFRGSTDNCPLCRTNKTIKGIRVCKICGQCNDSDSIYIYDCYHNCHRDCLVD